MALPPSGAKIGPQTEVGSGLSLSGQVLSASGGGVSTEWPVSVDFGQPASAYTATVSFPIAGTFAANLPFQIWASTNPTSTMSVVWKQRVSGSTTTVGTLSISTAGAITGVANSLITVAAGDAFTFDVPADATAVLGISFAGTKT
jgi:hypothetical protein